MAYKAVLSKTTTDMIKSKVLSTELTQLVLDLYITPHQFSDILAKFGDREFELEFKE